MDRAIPVILSYIKRWPFPLETGFFLAIVVMVFTPREPPAPWWVGLLLGSAVFGVSWLIYAFRRDRRVSLGVLSFTESGLDQAYGAGDNFPDEIVKRFAELRDIVRVVPRISTFRIQPGSMPASEIGERLHADWLVYGEIKGAEHEITVRAGLIDARHDAEADVLTAKVARKDQEEVFLLQGQVTEWVADALPMSLLASHRELLKRRPAKNLAAQLKYWQGRHCLGEYNNSRSPSRFDTAEASLKKAIELDSDYADAYAELGFLYLIRWETDGGPRWLNESERVFDKTAEIQYDNAVALSEKAYIKFLNGQQLEAVELAESVAQDNKDNTVSQNVLALLYQFLGFYEMNTYITERTIEPLDPRYIYPMTNASTSYALMGEYGNAVRCARAAKDIDSNAFVAYLTEGAGLFYQRDYEASESVWAEGRSLAPTELKGLFDVATAWIDATAGDPRQAAAVVAAHRADPWLNGLYDSYFITLCALAGEHDLAVEMLRSQVTYTNSYRYMVSEPALAALRDHPGFRSLLEERYRIWRSRMRIWKWRLTSIPPLLPAPAEF